VTAAPTLSQLVRDRHIIVCCGSGGVGKTTTAAVLALEAARSGRRACVVTIDPARRLANSLGVDTLPNTPTDIDGPWPGRLAALMLDPKRTFDDLVHREAGSPERAEGILANRIYRSLSTSLSGTHEYMAMEKLHELVTSAEFDLVVVDTPPSRNALDFLDAPRRLTHFLSNRLFQVLMMPTRASLRVMGVAAQALLRTIAKVAGAEIVRDAVTFFQLFEGMEEGFRVRAQLVHDLLAQPSTAFVLVAAPRPDSVDEAVHFAAKLEESGMSTAALVVNRVLPRFADAAGMADFPEPPPGPDGADYALMVANLRAVVAAAGREDDTIAALVRQVDPAPVIRVPMLETDVHDLAGLERVAGVLFGSGPPTGAGEGTRANG
jgi:anion-transporting  ArsA/GET3 family ATPase